MRGPGRFNHVSDVRVDVLHALFVLAHIVCASFFGRENLMCVGEQDRNATYDYALHARVVAASM